MYYKSVSYKQALFKAQKRRSMAFFSFGKVWMSPSHQSSSVGHIF
jgi:hypothetical protein